MNQDMTLLFGVGIVILYFWSTINIIKEYERAVIFRLGRLLPEAKGPGLIWVFWPVAMSHTLMLLSLEPDARYLPLCDHATAVTPPEWLPSLLGTAAETVCIKSTSPISRPTARFLPSGE